MAVGWLLVVGIVFIRTAFVTPTGGQPELENEVRAIAGYFSIVLAGAVGLLWYAQADHIQNVFRG